MTQVLGNHKIQSGVNSLFANGKGFVAMVATNLHNSPPVPGLYGKTQPGRNFKIPKLTGRDNHPLSMPPGRFRQSAGKTLSRIHGPLSSYFSSTPSILNYTTLFGLLKVIICL
jgi:hypothetical protein